MSKKNPHILAIETSCDETGLALLEKAGDSISVLSSQLASQIDIHKLTGGIVPEIAAREHVTAIQAMISDIKESDIDYIAVTVGPGLQPALSIGVTTAQVLSYAWQKPIIPIHHLEGHIYSALLHKNENLLTTHYSLLTNNLFPSLALIVSGGHTMLVEVKDHLKYKIIGSTRDDAAGEAFDKIARLIGLPYPGGPAISQLAQEGDPQAFNFSRPMINSKDFDFSFSGLKTEVFYTLRDINGLSSNKNTQAVDLDHKTKANLAASFEQAVVDTLVTKTIKAAHHLNTPTILLAGGVAANQKLRTQLHNKCEQEKITLLTAPQSLCGDNAIMIGLAAAYAIDTNRFIEWPNIDSHARISLEDFSA
jgi:N6-L-threonylcarbamoyladenine synthase